MRALGRVAGALLAWLLWMAPGGALAEEGLQVSVNGQRLPTAAVLGAAGGDAWVLATPFFQAWGGVVRQSGGHLEASLPGGVLILDAGSPLFSLNGQTGRFMEGVGSFHGDLVVKAGEVATLLGARIVQEPGGLQIWTWGGASQPPQDLPAPSPPTVSSEVPLPPLLYNPTEGLDQIYGSGMEGSGPLAHYQTPYERPELVPGVVEAPPPEPGPAAGPVDLADPSGLPRALAPPRIVVRELKARRIMDFHLTRYEVTGRLGLEGSMALVEPIQVKLLARAAYQGSFELLEQFTVRPFGPGEEVDFKKVVSGSQYRSLLGTDVIFKVQVVEPEARPVTDSRRIRTPGGDTREFRVRF